MKKGINVEQAAEIKKKKGLVPTKLESLRIMARLSQNELANRAGVSLRLIESYEQRTRPIDGARMSTLVSLCIVLNCKLEDILEDEDTIQNLKIVLYELPIQPSSEMVNRDITNVEHYPDNDIQTNQDDKFEEHGTSIRELELSGWAYNCLMREGCDTIEKAQLLTKEQLLSTSNIGVNVANEILMKIDDYFNNHK